MVCNSNKLISEHKHFDYNYVIAACSNTKSILFLKSSSDNCGMKDCVGI